ncbi:hypothetical protein STENM327S_02149 [Streptomyces tendae]
MAEDRVTTLDGHQVALLAPLLDGTRDLPTIIAEAAPALPADVTGRLVDRLLQAGLLHAFEADGPTAPERAYWSLTGLAARPGAAASPLLASVDLTAEDPGALRGAVSAAGLHPAPEDGGRAGLTLVLCHDYLDPRLGALDAEHRAEGRGWLPVRASGTHLWIGPFLTPGDGPCWSCLADRLRLRRRGEAHVRHRLGLGGPASHRPAYLPAGRTAALHLALLEAGKWLAGYRDPGQGELWRLDTRTLESSRHPVRRRPQCARCGDPGLVRKRVSAPVVLSHRPVHDTGGGYRTLDPGRMLERYGHLVDPVTGVVGEIRRDPRGPRFLNCFHASARPPWDPALPPPALRTPLRTPGSGKGVTETHARASALGEALERYSGHFQGDEPRLRGSYRELAPRAVHPDTVQLFDRRQFEDRAAWNAAHGPFHQVTEPFDEDAEIDWTPVWSLTGRRQRLAPTSLLYYNAPDADAGYCRATSNGAAAGTSLEDAVVHGCLELVERDAVALWWYNRTRQPGVELDRRDPWIAGTRAALKDLGRSVWALDLTSDLGIPVVAAVSARTATPAEDIVLGFGAHFDPRVALLRALTELNQMLPPLVDGPATGETAYTGTDEEALRWFRHATTANQPHLLPAARRPARPPRAPRPPADAAAQAESLVALLDRHGLEVLVLDQTRPDVQLPVAKVLVPGLRPHWAGFGPGRLFDVPVALGRLARPRDFAELNPLPLHL